MKRLMCIVLFLFLTGCVTTSSNVQQEEVAAPEIPIPKTSIFSKVKVGMSMKQVWDLIGIGSDTESYQTGKSHIPFYYGGDQYRTVNYYKGAGYLIFADENSYNSSMSLIEIHYDPTEDGYR